MQDVPLKQDTHQLVRSGRQLEMSGGRARDRSVCVVEDPEVTVRDGRLGDAVERVAHHLEVARQQEIVGVEEAGVAPAGLRERAVSRRRDAAVRLPERAHAGIAREARDLRARRVCRAVVDDDHLEVGHGLVEHGADRIADGRRRVVRGDDQRERRAVHRRTTG